MSEESAVSSVVDASYEFTRWKFITLLVGGLLVTGGIVTGGIASGDIATGGDLETDSGTGIVDSVTTSSEHLFTDGDTGTATVIPGRFPEGEVKDPAQVQGMSPAMVRGGFGLILGFCVGFAARVFLRLAALVAGSAFLIVFLFGYLGWVEIRWDVMSDQMNGILSSLGDQFASFRTFITGHIPATGMTGAGLLVGLRKK